MNEKNMENTARRDKGDVVILGGKLKTAHRADAGDTPCKQAQTALNPNKGFLALLEKMDVTRTET